MRPLTLEQYISLNEVLKPAPIMNDELFGEVYKYIVWKNNFNCITYIAINFHFKTNIEL